MTSKLKHKLECIASKVLHISIIQVIHVEDFYKKYSFAFYIALSFTLPLLVMGLLGGETTIGDLL